MPQGRGLLKEQRVLAETNVDFEYALLAPAQGLADSTGTEGKEGLVDVVMDVVEPCTWAVAAVGVQDANATPAPVVLDNWGVEGTGDLHTDVQDVQGRRGFDDSQSDDGVSQG